MVLIHKIVDLFWFISLKVEGGEEMSEDKIRLSPEETIAKIMANPEVAHAFQNPRVQAAIMDCSQNPLSIANIKMTRRLWSMVE
ncbi:protein TIC 40, chloroplastic-like isoform X2 [Corylus avellana]|uniref:protein TIC 40, chloroplastic-like isoform X2 n=1 Tax=Corylus avellana TaxID=13451 RepID=UPI00286B56B5|nr:protein TIC 40, chloroplastic-like isoform X2 [Corylus avellana]